MATGKRQPPGNPAARRRRPPTIELQATEVARGPAEPLAQSPPPPSSPAEPTAAAFGSGPRIEPPAEPAARAEPPPPPPREPPRRGPASLGGARRNPSWLPPDLPWTQIGAGAVGAAGVLVVFLLLWLVGLSPRGGDAMIALGPRLGAIETQLRDLAARPPQPAVDLRPIDDLAARLAKVEAALAAPRAPVTDATVLNRLAATDEAMRALTANIVQLTRRTDAVAASLVDLQNAARTSNADRSELVTLANRIAALEQSNQTLRDDIAKRIVASNAERGEIAGLANKIAALEQSNQALRDELARRVVATNSDRAVRLAVLASNLRGAVERGSPFASELAAVKSLAGDAAGLAALEPFAAAGVPSDAALGRELSALIEPMRRAAGTPPPDARFIDRLQANAQKLVRIRPVEEVPGDEPLAVLSRIDVKAAHAEIDGALAELAKLPAAMRTPAQSWIAKVQARKAAVMAASRFAAEALAALKVSP